MRTPLSLLLAPACLLAQASFTQPFGALERKAIVGSLVRELKGRYLFPEVAEKVAAALTAKAAKGGYDAVATATAYAEALTTDLRELGKDGHFRLNFDPQFKPRESEDLPPTSEELVESRKEIASRAFGIQRLERLPGNVGYLELREFGPLEFVGSVYDSAMTLLSGTEALILDLRRNGGGEPESVTYLLSHFFAEGDARHLNDIYERPKNATRQYWTTSAVGPRYTRPVYVLISARTFSAGEECAYDFQTQKRASLVGEITSGGAHEAGPVALGHGFVAFIPHGRAINPITKTNWEQVGVKPDLAVPAADAQKAAHAAILRGFLLKEQDPGARAHLEGILGRVEKGEIEKPVYTPLH